MKSTLFILITAGIVWSGYLFFQNRETSITGSPSQSAFKTFVDEKNDFSFHLPNSWTASSTQPKGDFNAYSPDHVLFTTPCDPGAYECYSTSWLTSGAEFHINSEPISASLDQEAYLAFKERIYKDCSNCSGYKRIDLNGVPATEFYLIGQEGEYAEGKVTGVGITFLYKNVGYSAAFRFDSLTPTGEQIVEEFVKSFKTNTKLE
jgi:hypothetical protein